LAASGTLGHSLAIWTSLCIDKGSGQSLNTAIEAHVLEWDKDIPVLA